MKEKLVSKNLRILFQLPFDIFGLMIIQRQHFMLKISSIGYFHAEASSDYGIDAIAF